MKLNFYVRAGFADRGKEGKAITEEGKKWYGWKLFKQVFFFSRSPRQLFQQCG